jgi:probable phosphoglycerate mutase
MDNSSPKSESTLFGLLRHGQTIWNTQGRVQGRLDSPLTPEGVATVQQWARFLAAPRWRWTRVLTSPAPRAAATAEIINAELRIDIQEEEDLREQDWGQWEGLSWSEIRASYGAMLQAQIDRGWSFRPPGGESRTEVGGRVRGLLTRLGRRHPGEQILVITHQGVIKSLIYAIEKRRFLSTEPKLLDKNLLQTVSCCNDTITGFAYNIEPLPRL